MPWTGAVAASIRTCTHRGRQRRARTPGGSPSGPQPDQPLAASLLETGGFSPYVPLNGDEPVKPRGARLARATASFWVGGSDLDPFISMDAETEATAGTSRHRTMLNLAFGGGHPIGASPLAEQEQSPSVQAASPIPDAHCQPSRTREAICRVGRVKVQRFLNRTAIRRRRGPLRMRPTGERLRGSPCASAVHRRFDEAEGLRRAARCTLRCVADPGLGPRHTGGLPGHPVVAAPKMSWSRPPVLGQVSADHVPVASWVRHCRTSNPSPPA